jgi:CelD/BcsL family acetyltransferase involved in cellulose biosynthesis
MKRMGQLHAQRITTLAQLMSIEPEWRSLYQRAGDASAYVDFDWVPMCWREQVETARHRPLIVTVRDRNRLVFCLPLQRERVAWTEGTADTAAAYGAQMIVDLEPGFEQYLATFSAATRTQLRRQQRQLGQDGSVPLRFSTVDTLEADIDWLLAHKRAWEPPSGRKLHDWLTTPHGERRFRELARKWVPDGRMSLAFIESDGRPVAGGIVMLSAKEVIYYLVTYDPARANLSPGRLFTIALIEWAATNDFEVFDMMGGTFEWKARLKTGDRPIRRYELIVPRWHNLTRRLARHGAPFQSQRRG